MFIEYITHKMFYMVQMDTHACFNFSDADGKSIGRSRPRNGPSWGHLFLSHALNE